MPGKRTNRDLIIGFSVVITLMIVMLTTAIYRMSSSQKIIEELVEEEIQENQHISNMHRVARERIITLQKMLVVNDPFEFDDLWMEFNQLAEEFIKSRQYFIENNPSPSELEYLQTQRDMSIEAVAQQEEVIKHLRLGNRNKAIDILVTRAIPTQDKVLNLLQDFLDIHQEKTEDILRESNHQYYFDRDMIVVVGIFAIWAGIWIGIIAISRTKLAQSTLQQEKERALTTLHSIGDAVITTDKKGKVQMLNPVALKMLAITEEEATGHDIEDVMLTLAADTRKLNTNVIYDVLNSGKVISNTQPTLLIDGNENEYVIEFIASPIYAVDLKQITGVVLVFRDVTDLHNLSTQLTFNASHDSLTGLINRREFEFKLEDLLVNARDNNTEHAMLYIDLDQFKVVNDTCGHSAGDELLSQLGDRLQNCVRETDILARLGGDEFGVLLSRCSLSKAEEIANYILNTIHDYRFSWEDNSFVVGASIGLVPITNTSGSLSSIMSKADSACYIAKDSGRNRIYVSHTSKDKQVEQSKGEMQWVQRLTSALDNDEFVLFCQPIVSSQDISNIHHYEILVRLQNPNGDITPPMAFIPAAERYNMMPMLDRHIIAQSLEKIAQLNQDYKFSINLSGQSLTDKEFIHFVTEQLDKNEINPEQICFEITETATIANLSLAMKFISVLKGMGCRFSLDDFGSGLSSFNYLKNLNVDYLKIDGSFIRDMHEDPIDRAFVSSINEIGHIIGLETIAEYVADENIYHHLRKMNVDYVQGYWLHTPFPLEQLELKSALKNAVSDHS